MHPFIIRASGPVLLSCLLGSAGAADLLEPLVVTPTRTAVTAEESVAPVIVIDRAEIERTPAVDVVDLLARRAGVEVARNGGFGQVTSVFLRGAESNHTLVMIDGVRIKPGSIGLAPLQDLSPEVVERIEIVKGPRSALYGSDAIGGVINIITRAPSGGEAVSLQAGVGNLGSRGYGARVQLGDEALRAEFSAQRYASDGYPVNDASTQDQGSDTLNATAQLAGRLGGLSWSLRHLRSEAEVEYWSFGDLSQDGRTRTTAFTATGNPVPRWRSTLTLSRFDDRIDQNEPNFLSEFDFTDTRRDQLDWQNDIAMGEWLLWTLGATYEDEQTQARSFGTFFDERKRVRAGFLQGDLDLDAHRLIAAARYSDDQSFGAETTWNLDYGWQLADAWRLTAGAGTGFRAPDATDLFGSIGNPDLEPETSRSAEVGLRYRPAKGQELRLNAFDNRIRNLIEPNAGFTSLENIDRARIRGLEFGYDWRGRVWSLGLEGVAQDPRNETDDELLPRRAERSASARLGYDQGPWSAGVQGLWVGERKDSSFSDIRLDAYSLLNLSLNYRLHAAWRLGLEVENLLDEDYETAATYPGRGRYVFVRLRHTTP